PLDIVDRNKKTSTSRERLQRAPSRQPEGEWIKPAPGPFLASERDFERAPARARQRRQDVVERIFEEIAEPDVSDTTLNLGRPRSQHEPSSVTRRCPRREPKRRLPDPRLALKHSTGKPVARPVEERVQRAELQLPSDDL